LKAKTLLATAAAVATGAAVALLTAQPAPVNPPPIFDSPFPTNIPHADCYWWSVLSSTDLVHWQNEPSSEDTNGVVTVHANGRPQVFFRWEGWPLTP
jgi:hypothetical protein